ncbi:MAG TPA: hypothetical protein VI197_27060 [Polyangiaceae bacterium]
MSTPRMPGLAGGAAALWLFSACSASDDPPVTPEPAPVEVAVELGTGEAEFEPIEGEPTLEMAAGFQGGFHVWLSVLGSGFEDERLDMKFVTALDGVLDSDLTMRATQKGRQVTNAEGEVFWTFAGYPGQVKDARCAHGKRVRLQVTLSDPVGREATDERFCIVALDEQYRSEDCE